MRDADGNTAAVGVTARGSAGGADSGGGSEGQASGSRFKIDRGSEGQRSDNAKQKAAGNELPRAGGSKQAIPHPVVQRRQRTGGQGIVRRAATGEKTE